MSDTDQDRADDARSKNKVAEDLPLPEVPLTWDPVSVTDLAKSPRAIEKNDPEFISDGNEG